MQKKVVYMNKKQATIQDLKQDKQSALKRARFCKTVAIIANCSAGVSAAFILIGAINNDAETTLSALTICMLLATTGAAGTHDAKKYTETASKFQRKINRTQGRQK